jgi:hypothetical protein
MESEVALEGLQQQAAAHAKFKSALKKDEAGRDAGKLQLALDTIVVSVDQKKQAKTPIFILCPNTNKNFSVGSIVSVYSRIFEPLCNKFSSKQNPEI